MARVLVQLDPEYVPWDVPEERPRMQRRRRRKRRGSGGSGQTVPRALFVAVPLLLLVACVVVAVFFGPHRRAETRAQSPVTAGSPPAASVAEGAGGNLAPSVKNPQADCEGAPALGELGDLTLYGTDDPPLTCSRYAVWLEGAPAPIAVGSTTISGCMRLDELYATWGGIVDMREVTAPYIVDCYE